MLEIIYRKSSPGNRANAVETEPRGREIPSPTDIVLTQIQPYLNMPEHL